MAAGFAAALAVGGVVVVVARSSAPGQAPVDVTASGRAEPGAADDAPPEPGPARTVPTGDSTTTTTSSLSSSSTSARPTTTTTKPRPTTTTTVAAACAPARPVYSLAILRRPDGNGWAGGANPALQRTDDGGRTWTPACLPAVAVTGSGYINGIAFAADGRSGWATGGVDDHPVAFRTIDGGDHWLASTLPAGLTGALGGVAFADDRHGWTVGSRMGNGPANAAGGYVLATADGGLTWAAQTVPAGVARLNRIVVADATHGWAVGAAGDGGPALIGTADGGATWSLQTLPSGIGVVRDVGFVDARRGWAVGLQALPPGQDPAGVVLTTGDGGATWAQQATMSGELWSLAVVDAGTLLAGGAHALWSSHDGGARWASQAFALPALDGISFTDADHGWVTHSMFSTVCRTDDGGRTWAASDVRPGGSGSACLPS